MEESKEKEASLRDPAKFRRPRQNGYEQNWFNVSTLTLDSSIIGIKEAIEDIQRQYGASNKKLKDLLTPFKVKEQIDVMKKYIPSISIKRIGDKIIWDRIYEKGIQQQEVSQMLDADIIVCMVEIVYENEAIRVSRASLRLLEQCLFARPGDIEIVIVTEMGIYASEAKRVVFETLQDRNLKIPKNVHHAADTNFEEIVVHRVYVAIKDICRLSKSLIDSFPEERETDEVVTDAYIERTSESNIQSVAMDVYLSDGNTAIGRVSNTPQYYYNQFKIEQIKKQLREQCTKTVIDQFGNTVSTNINAKILNRLELNEISEQSFYFRDFNIDSKILFETISKLVAAIIIGSILSVVFAPVLLVAVPFVAVFRFFSPVNVNDRSWRFECINVVVVRFREQRTTITSKASSILNGEFRSIKKVLETFTMRRDRSSPDKYDESTYNHHQRVKVECKSYINNENLRQHVKKIVITKNRANIYMAKEAFSIPHMPVLRIKMHRIPQSTDEDERIHKYLFKNKPKMEQLERDKIKTIISQSSERLFTLHSNLSIIGPSPVLSSDHGKNIVERPCIVFYCIGKGEIPIGEPRFPTLLKGIDIDVREGFFVTCCTCSCLSCSVGLERNTKTGSFGFVANKPGNQSGQGIITAAHVVVGDEILCRDVTDQKEHINSMTPLLVSPSDGDQRSPEWSRIYGTVSDIQFGFGIDAAFVEKMKGSQVHISFHVNQGQLSTPLFNIDQHLWDYHCKAEKCGRTTGRTLGYLYTDGNDCKWENGLIGKFVILDNQYLVSSWLPSDYEVLYQIPPSQPPISTPNKPFFLPGDSGCGVYIVDCGQYHPIGIAIASKDAGGKLCLVTPIKHILQALDLDMFPQNMEED